jgi:hypothetical protein
MDEEILVSPILAINLGICLPLCSELVRELFGEYI